MHENASGIYNEYLEIYFNEYKALSDAQTKKLGENMILLIYFSKHIFMISDLKMKSQLIQLQEKSDKEESIDLSDIPPLEGD